MKQKFKQITEIIGKYFQLSENKTIMKKIKLFLGVALLGAMSFGVFSAYDYVTMNEDEKFLLANIEALTQLEPGGGTQYYRLRTVGCGTMSMHDWIPYCCDGDADSCVGGRSCSKAVFGCD